MAPTQVAGLPIAEPAPLPVFMLPAAEGLPVIMPTFEPQIAGGVTAFIVPEPIPFVHVEAPTPTLFGEAVLGPAPGIPLGAIVEFRPITEPVFAPGQITVVRDSRTFRGTEAELRSIGVLV